MTEEITKEFMPHIGCLDVYNTIIGGKIVYVPNPDKLLLPITGDDADANLFLQTLDAGFSYHFPVKISPDVLWMLVIQGVAQHIKLNVETSRASLVKHKDKKLIEIRNDELLNDASQWATVLAALIDAFRQDLVDETILDVLIPQFTTTTLLETTAFSIGVMDVFSSFFDYQVTTKCAIPEIYLEGSLDDWQKFKSNLAQLEVYDLGWWVTSLYPILDKIAATVAGERDEKFWKDIYKLDEMSGGPFLNGWIINFFPYLKDKVYDENQMGYSFLNKAEILSREKTGNEYNPNEEAITGKKPFLGIKEVEMCLKLDNFQRGLSKVPFIWEKLGQWIDMEMAGGIMGISQDAETFCLIPEMGWCVKERTL